MYRLFIKRFLDIVFAFIGIIILAPVFLFILIYVYVKLGKPILFSQDRIGLNGNIFRMYKFRSMTNNTDENGILLPESERLTKAGIILRSTSLDELPELWSILIGNMSIIGPRPLPTYYKPFYTKDEWTRHNVRGGLLPPDSLSGVTTPSWELQFKYDQFYTKNVSFKLDLKILFKTFSILLKRSSENYGSCERPHLNEYRKYNN